MKTGLIIAGPIISPGYTPYFFDVNGEYRKSWVDYNSSSNVLNLIEQASVLFDCIVLVTWNTSLPFDFLPMIRQKTNVEIIELSENGFLDYQLNGRGTSKYHQVETMYAGAKKLGELGCDIIAKVRTTHGINVKILFDEVLRHKKRHKRAIGVSYMNLFECDRLVDYHFVGKTETVELLCESYLSSPELFEGVHEDYFWKFGNFLSGKMDVSQSHTFLERLSNNVLIISYWTQFFYPLNRKLLKNFYWRGIEVNSKLNFWIFWSFLFHSKSQRSIYIKTFGNLVLINLARSLVKHAIRPYSFFAYKFYRSISANQSH